MNNQIKSLQNIAAADMFDKTLSACTKSEKLKAYHEAIRQAKDLGLIKPKSWNEETEYEWPEESD